MPQLKHVGFWIYKSYIYQSSWSHSYIMIMWVLPVNMGTIFHINRWNMINLIFTLFDKSSWLISSGVTYIYSRYQLAKSFTKGIPIILFNDFCNRISIRPTHAPAEGVYYYHIWYQHYIVTYYYSDKLD